MIKRYLLFLGLGGFLLIAPLHAATILMDHSIGLGGAFRLNTWTPVSIVIENRGNLIEGTLEIVARSGNEYKNNMEETVYQKKVELPPNSLKKYNFTLFLRTAVHPLKVRLYQHDDVLLSESWPLLPHVSDRKMILLVGERGNSSLFNDLAVDQQMLFVRPAALPERWYGYDGVDLMMMQTAILKNLEARQFQALVEWVQNGGFLIISGGVDYSFFTDPAMEQLATIRVIGLERAWQLYALTPYTREGFVSKNPFLILNARVGGGQVLLKEGSVPLVTEKSVGVGKVLFLAFDFQSALFQGWPGNLNFWHWLNAARPAQEPSLIEFSENEIFPLLISSISFQFPIYYAVLAYLLVYGILTRVLFQRLSHRRLAHHYCFGVPHRPILEKRVLKYLLATFFIFSVGSVWFYHHFQATSPQQNQFTLLSKPARSPMVYAQHWTAVYAFQSARYPIENEASGPPVRLLEGNYVKDVTKERFFQKEDQEKRTLEVYSRRWSYQFLDTQYSFPFPLVGEFAEEARQVEFVIENQTPWEIRDGFIVWAQRLIPIGNLPPQKRKILELSKLQMQDYEFFLTERLESVSRTFYADQPDTFLGRFQKKLSRPLFEAILERYSRKDDRVLLIGWLQIDGSSPFPEGTGATKDHIALLEWEFLERGGGNL